MAATVAGAVLLLVAFALRSAWIGEHGRHGAAMGAALGLALLFLPFHLGPGTLEGLLAFRGPVTVHRLAALGGLALGLAALPLGLRALAYRHGRIEDPHWPRHHKALARPAALLLAAAALLGLLQSALRHLGP